MSIRSSRATRVSGDKGRPLRSLLFAGTALSASLSGAQAQPVFDGTTGNQAPGTVVTDSIDVSQGTRAGGNVFHSFSTFSIGAGQTVTFTDNTPTTPVERIINRVTGTSISEINGTLRSIVPGADFYFINPNGVVMGSGSVVDVPASFHLSTADELRFDDGSVFQASIGSSTFSSAVPKAFGFTDAMAGEIKIAGAQIIGQFGADMSIVGGAIAITDGLTPAGSSRLETSNGAINLVAVSGPAVVPLDPADETGLLVPQFGDVVVAGSLNPVQIIARSPTDLTPSGITLRGRHITINQALVETQTDGAAQAGDVIVRATGDISSESSVVGSTTTGAGDSGAVAISAQNLRSSSFFGTTTLGEGGNAGDIDIRITNLLELVGRRVDDAYVPPQPSNTNIGSFGYTSERSVFLGGAPESPGNTGSISVSAGSITANDAYSVVSRSLRNSGDVTVSSLGALSLTNSLIDSASFAGFYGGYADSRSGVVNIIGSDVRLLGGSRVSSYSDGNPKSGGVRLRAIDLLVQQSSISGGSANGFGLATGDVDVAADRIVLDGGQLETNSGDIRLKADMLTMLNASSISSFSGRDAKAGDINIAARSLAITDGSRLRSDTGASGLAGNINLVGETLVVRGRDPLGNPATLSADAQQIGAAGRITISMRTVDIQDGGQISAVAFGAGAAGTVVVCCNTSFSVSGTGSRVVAGTAPRSTGDAGRILISAKDVKLRNGGRMTVASDGSGRGGEILVRTQQFTAEGAGAGLATLSGAAGNTSAAAGRIAIEAGVFNLLDGAVITTDTFGSVPAGTISLRTSELNIKGNSTQVASRAIGSNGANAGNIDIGTFNFALSDGAAFSTLAESGGGGNIVFAWSGTGRIDNALVTTEVVGGSGNAGNIVFGQRVLPDLNFKQIFDELCPDLAFDPFEGTKPYDPRRPGRPILIVSNPPPLRPGCTGPICATGPGGGGDVIIDPSVIPIVEGGCTDCTIDVSSPEEAGTKTAPQAFAPPSAIILPERNVTSRCDAARRHNALTDGLTGRMDVGDDTSALLPAGLPGSADALLAATADRLCGV